DGGAVLPRRGGAVRRGRRRAGRAGPALRRAVDPQGGVRQGRRRPARPGPAAGRARPGRRRPRRRAARPLRAARGTGAAGVPPGVYLFPAGFEQVIGLLRTGIAAMAAAEPFRRLAIPPVISRRTIEQAGYVKAFPQLLGTVHSFPGDSRAWARLAPRAEVGGDW